jgi:hypothetical protein
MSVTFNYRSVQWDHCLFPVLNQVQNNPVSGPLQYYWRRYVLGMRLGLILRHQAGFDNWNVVMFETVCLHRFASVVRQPILTLECEQFLS